MADSHVVLKPAVVQYYSILYSSLAVLKYTSVALADSHVVLQCTTVASACNCVALQYMLQHIFIYEHNKQDER